MAGFHRPFVINFLVFGWVFREYLSAFGTVFLGRSMKFHWFSQEVWGKKIIEGRRKNKERVREDLSLLAAIRLCMARGGRL